MTLRGPLLLYCFNVRVRRAVEDVKLRKATQMRDGPYVLHRSTAVRANRCEKVGLGHPRKVGDSNKPAIPG
jgi:hypothetical protein